MKKRYTKQENYNLLILKALRFFIDNPYKEIHLREFSRKLKISPNSSQRFLNLFLKEKLIKEERKANLRYFKANLDSLVFRFIKKTHSIKKIEDSGIIDYLKNRGFSNIVLFGSVAKGLDDEKSDIDIVCIGPNKKIALNDFYAKLSKEINAHFFTLAEWKKQKQENKAFYQDVISTGINLIGETAIID